MKAIRPDKTPTSDANFSPKNGRATDVLNERPVVHAARHLEQENARLVEENAKLARERDSLRRLIDGLPDNLFIKDRESRFLISNLAQVRTLGANHLDEVIGKTDLDIFPPELSRQYFEDEQKLMESGGSLNREEVVVNPQTGEKRWLQTTKVSLRDPQGKIVGLMGIHRDITKLKQAEEHLRQAHDDLEKRVAERTAQNSQERLQLRTLIDNLPDYVYIKDAPGRFVLANLAVARQMGFSSPDEIIGKSDFDLFPHELAARYRAEEEEMIRSGKGLFNHEGPTVDASKRGKHRWVATTKVILRDAQGKVTGFIGLGRDITERKRMEEVLAQERSLLRTLINNLPDSIYAKDSAGRKILANPADLKNCRCKTEAEAIGKTDFDLFPKEIAEKFYADDMKVIHGQAVINREEYFLDDSHRKRWLMTSKLPLRDQNQEIIGLVGIGRDITEQKQAEQTIANERALLRTLVDHLPVAVYLKDLAGRKTLANLVEISYAGATSEAEVLGKTDADLFPPEVAAVYRADDQKVLDSGHAVINREGSFTKPDGSVIWLLTSKVPLRDATGNVTGLAGINTDITDLKKSENALRASEGKLRQFTTQLERSNRELQDFAYVASHDLQEPLRKIVVFGERLKEQENEKLAGESRDYLERMQKAAARMQTLINDLLTFSRVTTKARPFTQVDLAQVAREVITDLEGRIELVKGRVELGTLPLIDAEALQMRQLFQNLIGNALKFRRLDVPPVVKVAAEIIHGPAPDEGVTVTKKLCRLTVSDNGIGFDEKYLDRIFNVFQRLHSRNEYEGTGMGLAIARKIALFHRGEITAKSKPGEGTTFMVTLPVTHPREPQTVGENHE